VWAIARPDLHVTLIEPLLRRTTWLEEVVADLGLGSQVTVVRARAEDVSERYDVVTARAVAGLDKLGRWCMPLVRPGGVLLALKGRSASDEVKAARATLARLHAGDIVVATYGEEWGLEVPTTLVEVQRR
jgi:16S rRNA (guanine527-N7)-methyltransferase